MPANLNKNILQNYWTNPHSVFLQNEPNHLKKRYRFRKGGGGLISPDPSMTFHTKFYNLFNLC